MSEAIGATSAFIRKPRFVEKRLNELEGLSHHHTTGIVEDKDGLIWIGTWNGLNRYDGYGFTTFKPRPGDGSPLNVGRIKDIHINGYQIYCNVEGHCFVFDIRNGKFRDSHKLWEQILNDMHFPTTTPRQLTGRDGTLWTVDSLGVLMRYRYPNISRRLLWQPGCQVRCIFRDHNNNIWVCSRDDRSVRLYDSRLNLKGFLGQDGKMYPNKVRFLSSVYCMYQDHDGQLWLGCKPGGLLKIKAKTTGGYNIESISHDINGRPMGHEVYSIRQDKWRRLIE